MNAIKEQIMEKLHKIESDHQVKILFAVESGSRAWGFASPDSDYDCRFVYVHPQKYYLSIFKEEDTIDYVPDAIFDLNGWDIRKFIQHLVKSNAVMLEWLKSSEIYRKNETVTQQLWDLGEAFFNPVSVAWHYLSMARNKFSEITENGDVKIKTYFYIMRPLACIRFIKEHGEIPFMEYRRNLESINVPEDIRCEIEILMNEKRKAKESRLISRNEKLLAYFSDEIAGAEAWLQTLHNKKHEDREYANQCFQNILEMAKIDD